MRDYDPTLGRYLQADPLGLVDGASVYGYALQNPGMYTDPRGEQSVPDWMPRGPYGPRTPNGRYLGPKQSSGPRPYCEYVPKNSVGTHDPYWKNYSGNGKPQRYDLRGNPITAEQAHPGNPSSNRSSPFDRLLRLPRFPAPFVYFPPNLMFPPCSMECPQT